MPEVVTFGEPLILLAPETLGPLRHVDRFTKSVVGAELNFSIGVSRLGLSSGWFGRVGDEEFGLQVVESLRAEGVDTSRVRFAPDAPTAVMFKEHRGFGEPRVYYYRNFSAAAQMGPADIDEGYIAGARCLHVTGITAALSDNCREAIHRSLKVAKEAGVLISVDPNVRRKLMPPDRIHDLLLPLVDAADILLMGLDEGELLFGVQGVENVIAAALARGPRTVAVKLGGSGAVASDGTQTVQTPAFKVQVVDTVGAGDGFDAGFVYGHLKGWRLTESLRLGAVCGACAVTVSGDYEGYPRLQEAEQLLGMSPKAVER